MRASSLCASARAGPLAVHNITMPQIVAISFSLQVSLGRNVYKQGNVFVRRENLVGAVGECRPWRFPTVVTGRAAGSALSGQFECVGNALKFSVPYSLGRSKFPGHSLACLSTLVNNHGAGGGGRGGFGRGGGGGGDGSGDGFGASATKGTASVGGEQSDEVPMGMEFTDDTIVLDVGGMSCGGCASSVKRILESQPQVLSATVNLATEIAVIKVIPDVEAQRDWTRKKPEVAEVLAKHLTSCGFKSTVRVKLNADAKTKKTLRLKLLLQDCQEQ